MSPTSSSRGSPQHASEFDRENVSLGQGTLLPPSFQSTFIANSGLANPTFTVRECTSDGCNTHFHPRIGSPAFDNHGFKGSNISQDQSTPEDFYSFPLEGYVIDDDNFLVKDGFDDSGSTISNTRSVPGNDILEVIDNDDVIIALDASIFSEEATNVIYITNKTFSDNDSGDIEIAMETDVVDDLSKVGNFSLEDDYSIVDNKCYENAADVVSSMDDQSTNSETSFNLVIDNSDGDTSMDAEPNIKLGDLVFKKDKQFGCKICNQMMKGGGNV